MSASSGAINLRGGSWPALRTVELINRSGGTLVKGDIVSQNLDFAATSGQAMTGLDPNTNTDAAAGWIGGAVIDCTTANILRKALVCLSDSVADNTVGVFVEEGECLVNQNGSNAGEFLCGTDGQTYATPLTAAELAGITTAPVRVYGIALAAGTAGTPVKALWNANGLAGLVVGVS